MRLSLIVVFIALTPPTLDAQDPLRPHPAETLRAVLSFLDYDETIPLDPHVVATDQPLGVRAPRIVDRPHSDGALNLFASMPFHGNAWLLTGF